MRQLEKFVHAALLLFGLLCLALIARPVFAADMDLTLTWGPPAAGGPVTDYQATCTDAAGTVILDVVTAETTAAATASGVAEGAGSCSLIARGPGGESAPVVATWSISVELPPGPPTNFQITLDCSVVEGVVLCEQV